MVLKSLLFYYYGTMPRHKKAIIHHPIVVQQSLRLLGQHLSIARKKRSITVRDMATRMMVSPTTVIKLEKGDPGVSIGAFATALWILGFPKKLGQILAPETDAVGLLEDSKSLPQRVRKKNKPSLDF